MPTHVTETETDLRSELRSELQDKLETIVSMLRDVSDELAEEVHREAAQLHLANEGLREELSESQQRAAHERAERERIERMNSSLFAELEAIRVECVEFELAALRAELARNYDRGEAAEREAALRAQIVERSGDAAATAVYERRIPRARGGLDDAVERSGGRRPRVRRVASSAYSYSTRIREAVASLAKRAKRIVTKNKK